MKKITLAALALLFGFGSASFAADTFFVANTAGNSITRYDEKGNGTSFASSFLNGPIGIALDRSGNLFISTNSNTIEEFSSTGTHLETFATVAQGLNNPFGLAFDSTGNLYVANFAGSTVEKFAADGTAVVFANIAAPTGLAFDSSGNLYVATSQNIIERFAPDGTDLGILTQSNLNNPQGIALDSLGNVYAANNATGIIEKFSPAGTDLGEVVYGLGRPVGVGFDSAGSLYAVDAQSARIVKVAKGSATDFAGTSFNPAFIAIQTPPQLANISTRGDVLTGDNVLDAGFIVTGPGPKQVLIRGIGPSLASAGVPGALADPILELHDSTGAVLAINDNWKQTQQSAIEATGIAPTSDSESAILMTLNAGSYTVIERGVGGGTGVGLVETYDLSAGFGPELANISTRGFVDTGNNVMIAGFIVAGRTGGTSSVLVRGLGPSLGNAGVSDPLANPILELHDGNGNLIASNDDWESTQAAEISATGIPPNDPSEAAILATLAPGNYTAIESGQNSGTGVGLVEVYNLH